MSSSASTPGSGDRVALDTSVAIDVLAAKADARLLAGINEHLLPAPVVGELRYGSIRGRRPRTSPRLKRSSRAAPF